MEQLGNFTRKKEGLESNERPISELFAFGWRGDYYSLEQVILKIGLLTRKQDIEIYFYEPVLDENKNVLFGKGGIKLFAEGYEAFYKFIELSPKYIYENVSKIIIYDRELDLTYWFEAYAFPVNEKSPWYSFWIKQGKDSSIKD